MLLLQDYIMKKELSNQQKNPESFQIPGLVNDFGGVLLSHTASRAVPSALKSLTSVFEMGTGVTSSLLPPKNVYTHFSICFKTRNPYTKSSHSTQSCELFCGQAARPISTGKLNMLPHLHTRPINLVVYKGSSVLHVSMQKGYLILK